jgi:AcrR family transcriptional regulator
MTGRGRRDTAEDERALLIKGARTVLRRSGFDGLKVNLVLRETGLSARTFYRHFADKSSLVVALISEEYAATARRLTDATGSAGSDPELQVSTWIRELLLGVVDPRRQPRTRLFSTHFSVMSAFPEAAAEASDLVIQPLRAAISRGAEIGIFARSDPQSDAVQIARLVGGAMTEVLTQRPGTREVDDVVRSTTDFALRALRSDPTIPT